MPEKLRALWNLKRGEAVWVIGAGGKTSTLNQLAREFSYHQVVYTATTAFLRPYQLPHRVVITPSKKSLYNELSAYRNRRGEREVLVVASEKIDYYRQKEGKTKFKGLPPDWLDYAGQRFSDLIFLIEADGAANHSCKVPADWEPALPEKPEVLLLVQGFSNFGSRVHKGNFHRSSIVMEENSDTCYLNQELFLRLFTDIDWYGSCLNSSERSYFLLTQVSYNRKDLVRTILAPLLQDFAWKREKTWPEVKGITVINYRKVLKWLYHIEFRKDGRQCWKINHSYRPKLIPGSY